MPAPVAVLFITQSNIGYGMSAATLPDHLKAPILGTYTFTSTSTHWGVTTPGTHNALPNTPGTWGSPEQFAYNFHAAHPDTPLLMIEVSKGSTGVAQDAGAYDMSPNSDGELFDLTEETIARAMAEFERATGMAAPKLSATFIIGMETDATTAEKAAGAHGNLTGLVDAVRDRLMGDPDGFVGITRIGDEATLPFNLAVRQAQWMVDQEDDHLLSFKTVGLDRQDDDLHWAASTHQAVGHGFSSMFEEWF